MSKNIVFIPLRKGSKSIRNKNFKKFFTQPLFCWCVDAVLESGIADEIWIGADSLQIERITKDRYGDKVSIYRRKKENAQDTSPTIDVVLEFLQTKNYHSKDNFILVQATSPLTSVDEFRNLGERISFSRTDSSLACVRMKKFRWSEEGVPLDYSLEYKPRRQEYEGFLVESGAFYASTVGRILQSGKLISGKIGIVELGGEAVIDIDEPVDWKMGEACLRFIKTK